MPVPDFIHGMMRIHLSIPHCPSGFHQCHCYFWQLCSGKCNVCSM